MKPILYFVLSGSALLGTSANLDSNTSTLLLSGFIPFAKSPSRRRSEEIILFLVSIQPCKIYSYEGSGSVNDTTNERNPIGQALGGHYL